MNVRQGLQELLRRPHEAIEETLLPDRASTASVRVQLATGCSFQLLHERRDSLSGQGRQEEMHVIRHDYESAQPALRASANSADLRADEISLFRRERRPSALEVCGDEEDFASVDKTAKAGHGQKLA